jgi:hypothetical protein
MDPKSGLRMIRRLVVWGSIAWVVRWAVLFAASVLERRQRQ